ncbi:MAG: hypothetical protein IJS28_03440 [Synergistaceae bacterium]|nr:hypothetical protein [Synergistaceae bacterium]
MGEGKGYICPECGYSFTAMLGIGMRFPYVYRETVSAMKHGELGEEAQKFFAEHPDGAVSCELVMMKCAGCGEYDCRKALTMYVLKEGYAHEVPEGIWSTAMPHEGLDYVSPDEIKVSYTKYAEYPHKCEACGGDMQIVSDDAAKVCPNCGHELEDEGIAMLWD